LREVSDHQLQQMKRQVLFLQILKLKMIQKTLKRRLMKKNFLS